MASTFLEVDKEEKMSIAIILLWRTSPDSHWQGRGYGSIIGRRRNMNNTPRTAHNIYGNLLQRVYLHWGKIMIEIESWEHSLNFNLRMNRFYYFGKTVDRRIVLLGMGGKKLAGILEM